MASVGRLLLIVIIVLILIDIIALSTLNYSFSWVFEVTEYLLLFIPFLGVAFVLKREEHIKLDFLLNLLNIEQRTMVEIINSFIGLITSLIIAVFGFLVTWKFLVNSAMTEAVLQLPRFIIVGIIPISFVFVTIQFLRNITNKIEKYKNSKV
ncbi:TRAP transporter small permease [Salibacterium aidingense]|uniref:TRAP transporter small permease n=1 Tax=Salibacterium aidingense TaxID=384933 RepID=UPI001E2FF9CC|nr:TRAP transporter small permease [Salibacterium aidingense]